MAYITFRQKGDFKKTKRFFKKAKEFDIDAVLQKYGKVGVKALASTTPKESVVQPLHFPLPSQPDRKLILLFMGFDRFSSVVHPSYRL